MGAVPAAQPSLRIALTLESDYMGGAETMLLRLGVALRERGHEVHYIGPVRGDGWLGAQFREQGFATHGYLLRRALDPLCALELRRLLRALRIDALHSHEFAMAFYGAAATLGTRTTHVVTMHGNLAGTELPRRRLALRWAFANSAAVAAVSDQLKTDLEARLGRSFANLCVVENGVPERAGDGAGVRAELGVPPETPLLLSLGTHFRGKGHAVLLRALTRLDGGRPWHLAIAGRFEEETPALRELVAARGWQDRVHLLGPRTDVADLLAAADVFVHPSLGEGLPLVLLEAMFARKPIVITRVGGIPTAVTDEEHALLCDPGDEEGLARQLGRLLADRSLAGRLADAAYARASERYGIDVMTDAYLRLYRGR